MGFNKMVLPMMVYHWFVLSDSERYGLRNWGRDVGSAPSVSEVRNMILARLGGRKKKKKSSDGTVTRPVTEGPPSFPLLLPF